MISNITTKKSGIFASISKEKLASISAILLGGAFIFLIGFLNIEVVHNAAHDTRHSSSFPCH
jgi:cobalt transporter subunit CbtB